MIDFNVPVYVGKEKEYISQAIDNRKICGDGGLLKSAINGLKKKQVHISYLLHQEVLH